MTTMNYNNRFPFAPVVVVVRMHIPEVVPRSLRRT